MKRIKVGESGWTNDALMTAPNELISIAEQMRSVADLYTNQMSPNPEEMCVLVQNISDALSMWTGSTYVGVKKDEKLELAYTTFFNAFYAVLTCLLDVNENCRMIAQRMLYDGVLYRYLGHSSGAADCYSRVEPEYNNMWVSWSKDDVRKNPYLNSKLYGTKTLLICKTNHLQGIDLAGWDELFGTCIVRANESEVVYPTLKDAVYDVKYID